MATRAVAAFSFFMALFMASGLRPGGSWMADCPRFWGFNLGDLVVITDVRSNRRRSTRSCRAVLMSGRFGPRGRFVTSVSRLKGSILAFASFEDWQPAARSLGTWTGNLLLSIRGRGFSIVAMLQTGEIIVIVLIALIVLGPTRLPDLARKVGRWTNELRTAAREITRGLEAEVADLREVGKELKAPMDEAKKPFTEIRDEVSGFGPKGREWKGPKPVSGPTPEDAMRDLEEINRSAEEEAKPPVSPSPSPGGDTSPNPPQGEETEDESKE